MTKASLDVVKVLACNLLRRSLDRRGKGGGLVHCEETVFHIERELSTGTTISTPRRLPEKLSPPPIDILLRKEDAKKSVSWTSSTPRPSAWPFDCVLNQINSNSPVEDRGVITVLQVKKKFPEEPAQSQNAWLMASVIDGHSGWQTAEYISKMLGRRVQRFINETPESMLTASSVSRQLCKCFEKLDDDLRGKIEPAFDLGHCSVAKAGATTCAVFVTPTKIIAANVGDSRAYLCRNGRSIELTKQHNAGDEQEAARLREAHPNEDDLIKVVPSEKKAEGVNADPISAGLMGRLRCWMDWMQHGTPKPPAPACYTKGRLQLTRAFGDFYLKDAKFAADWDNARLLVNTPHSFPYVLKSPEICILDRDYDRDDFLIVASDGVWDELTPDEAIAAVLSTMKTGTIADATKKLQTMVLERAAKQAALSIEEMKKLAPRQRRDHYDDMTIAIVNLRQQFDIKSVPLTRAALTSGAA